jgi:hypothetical protein
MTEIEKLVDTHLAAYTDPDEAQRLAAIRRTWHAQGRLIDPPMGGVGHEGISDLAAKVVQQFPGHRFARTTAVDAHNEFARYGWKLQDPQGKAVLEGWDFVTLDVDGRLLQVVGFFGAQAPAAS